MKEIRIRSYIYILDGARVVGKVKTKAQSKRFIENARRFDSADAFESKTQKLIDYTASVEEEIGYEFNSKQDVLKCLQQSFPEVYDIDVDLDRKMFAKIFVSGIGFHLIITFVSNSVIANLESLEEMSEFNSSCSRYGFALENYGEVFKVEIGGKVKKVKPVGFDEEKVIIRLADGNKSWIAPVDMVLKSLKLQRK